MRAELYDRLRARNVVLPRPVFDGDSTLIDRIVGDQIARYVFGPDAEFERVMRRDRDITTALGMLEKARTPQELIRAGTHTR
jgi:hypothetical protein